MRTIKNKKNLTRDIKALRASMAEEHKRRLEISKRANCITKYTVVEIDVNSIQFKIERLLSTSSPLTAEEIVQKLEANGEILDPFHKFSIVVKTLKDNYNIFECVNGKYKIRSLEIDNTRVRKERDRGCSKTTMKDIIYNMVKQYRKEGTTPSEMWNILNYIGGELKVGFVSQDAVLNAMKSDLFEIIDGRYFAK